MVIDDAPWPHCVHCEDDCTAVHYDPCMACEDER